MKPIYPSILFSAPYPYGDGMGGVLGAYASSPCETNIAVPGTLPPAAAPDPPVVIGNFAQDDPAQGGTAIKGTGGPAPEGLGGETCGVRGCDFRARSAHGLARHVHSAHGYGGLGRRLGK